MSPQSFATSPAATGEQRKFINPTSGFVGANIFGPDGKPTAIPVEPGGEVWLTEAEERMTAEAPRNAADNPFIKEWSEIVEYDRTTGEPLRSITRTGTLVLADEAPRPLASSRPVPPRRPEPEPEHHASAVVNDPDAPFGAPPRARTEVLADDKSDDLGEQEVVGTETEPQPPTEGTPSPDEIVATPEAEPEASATARERPADDEPLGI